LTKGNFFDHESEKRLPIPREAFEACRNCPVLLSCREYAIKHEGYGFWGGLTAKERKKIRDQRGIQLQTRPLL
jgi:hypothetical protein